MKTCKIFELSELPEEFHKKCRDKHYRGNYIHYPGDGYFKPLSEVRDMSKIHLYKGDSLEDEDVYVYEEGDDPLGDWLMKNGAKFCEHIEIEV